MKLAAFAALWAVLNAGVEPRLPWFVLTPVLAASTIDAARFGARPGGDAAANTRAIQAALDAAGSAGGGTVAINRPGVYDLAVQGPNPYFRGHQYCLELRFDNLHYASVPRSRCGWPTASRATPPAPWTS